MRSDSSVGSGRGPTKDISPRTTLMQLRQFVEAGFADEGADPGDPWIVFHLEQRPIHLVELCDRVAPLPCVSSHRAELEDPEWLTGPTDCAPGGRRPARGCRA